MGAQCKLVSEENELNALWTGAQDLTAEEDEQTDGSTEQKAVLAQVSAPPLSPMAAKTATDSLRSPDLAFMRI